MLLAPVLTAMFTSGAVAAEPVVAGRYTNVRYVAGADDYVGLNLEVRTGPSPTVGYELCEGWCNGPVSFPAKVEGRTVLFTVKQALNDQDGRPAAPLVYRVEARLVQTPRGRRMIVTSPDNEEFREVLRPVGRGR